MREILFRGKRTDNEKWVCGDFRNTNTMYPHDAFIALENGIHLPVKPETVGQYTGMKDKNDNRIFEGDIIKLEEEVKNIFNVSDGEVKYGWGGFYIGKFSTLNSLNTLASYNSILRGEVVGNIHDNPELLTP